MKMERISENQIRCTLNKEDLIDRDLRISELAYGTDKAKELFRDMMQQASYELGFEAEDIPLMIEAIPASPESLILLITKVEDPDELDTRFSRFSSDSEIDEYEEYEEESPDGFVPAYADDSIFSGDTMEKDFIPLSDAVSPQNIIQKGQPKPDTAGSAMNTIRIFSFDNLEDIIAIASELGNVYHGANSLYKDTEKGLYYLIMSQDDHSSEEFHKIVNRITEFGQAQRNTYATLAYFEEHFEQIIKANALKVLADL